MRKYYYIFKSEVMSSLKYVFNIFINFIVYFLLIFVFLCLWQYMYSDPTQLINGYSMHQMMWYLIVTETLYSVVSGRKYCKKLSEDVKGGSLAYNLNKPYSYIEYCLFSHLGEISIKGIVYVICSFLIGLVFIGEVPQISILSIIPILLTIIMSLFISTTILMGIGLLSFFIEDSSPFYWMYSKIILVFGTIFPIEFFPKIIQPFIKFSPIYAISYGPANLFVDFKWEKFLLVIFTQIIYFVISYLIVTLIYRKGVRRLNVNGS